jgi:plasmid stability protein
MANLQIRNMPDELHEALRQRASRERVTLSELASRMLERELEIGTMQSWLQRRAQSSIPDLNVDSIVLLDEVRDEYDRH